MISFIVLKGGLGNQAFQYMLGTMIEASNNTRMIFIDYTKNNSVKRDLDVFTIFPKNGYYVVKNRYVAGFFVHGFRLLSRLGLRSVCVFKKSYQMPSHWMNFYYEGYFQNCRVIGDQFIKKIEYDFFPRLCEKKVSDRVLVGIHFRRGDYINDGNYSLLSEEYYTKAVRYIYERVHNPLFVVFSDSNSELSHAFFKKLDIEYMIASSLSATDDFLCFASSQHYIISNSSFSLSASLLGRNAMSICVGPLSWGNETNTPVYDDNWYLI